MKYHYLEDFNKSADGVPRASVLSSFRLWKVAFMAAVGGGAMLTAANPLLVAAMVPSSLAASLSSSSVMAYISPLIPFVGPSSLTNSVSAALTFLINLVAKVPQLSVLLKTSSLPASLPMITGAMNSASGHLLVSQALGGYGAMVAGSRMLKRTAPLRKFVLEPLHMPSLAPAQQQPGTEIERFLCLCYRLLTAVI